MKKVILGLVVMFGIMSCNDSENVRQSKLGLLRSASMLSSIRYNTKIKEYLIDNKTNVISFKVLDSLNRESDKYCDSILSNAVNKTY